MIFQEQYPKYREQHITDYTVWCKLASLAVALEAFTLASIAASRLTLELSEIQHGADLPKREFPVRNCWTFSSNRKR